MATPTGILAQHRTDASGDYYYLYNYSKITNTDAGAGPAKDHSMYPDINKKVNFSPTSVITQKRPLVISSNRPLYGRFEPDHVWPDLT